MGVKNYLSRFAQYTIYGSGAAVADITILWMSVELFGIHYVIGTVAAFVAATFINYVVFRRFLFNSTTRSFHVGYAFFLTFATIGMLLTVGCMVLFIEAMNMNILLARVITAVIVGIWNFSMNYFLTFKTTDKFEAQGTKSETNSENSNNR